MEKLKKSTIYYMCLDCGHTELKWLGKCPACSNWNTFQKKYQQPSDNKHKSNIGSSESEQSSQVITLSEIDLEKEPRMSTSIDELDRVLGGGIVPGSVVLFGGDPGIGKSTLMLQASHNLDTLNFSTLYVSGEESLSQLKLRCERLGLNSESLLFASITDLRELENRLNEQKPQILIIDSIQSLYTPEIEAPPGSLSQVKHCAAVLHSVAKENEIACLIVGHVTKAGQIAGPKVLEHIVDTVLYFEGDHHQDYRILRSIKNRFGPIEIGVFEMRQTGLQEITNPSKLFLRKRPDYTVGSAILPSLEGTRAFLVEIQALVSTSQLGTPRRVVTGIDSNRAALITAVLEKKSGLHLVGDDIFINVVGGAKVAEPAADLAVALSLISSFKEQGFPGDLVVMGEIGLTGEIRSCNQPEKRLLEAERMGFKKAILPEACRLNHHQGNIEIYPVSYLKDVLEILSG
ncbi:DNA repair protein RadA [Natranaerobius thermophilus]|uniref:DNA repair protein RadA n=1 Tax=Natranaerobius thermophilus TaxID=375929 RepID=UPI000320897F